MPLWLKIKPQRRRDAKGQLQKNQTSFERILHIAFISSLKTLLIVDHPMKKLNFLFFTFCFLLFFSCSHPYYTSSEFSKRTAGHKTVAVLPPQMIFTGNLPKDINAENMQQVLDAESRLCMGYVYNGIMLNNKRHSYKLTVEVQDTATTLQMLANNKISLSESWTKNDDTLCKLLHVDAVVRTKIHKDRIMSGLASFGLYTAGNFLLVPNFISKTSNDIVVSSSINAGGQTVWNDVYEEKMKWAATPDFIIEQTLRKIGRHFPYIKKK